MAPRVLRTSSAPAHSMRRQPTITRFAELLSDTPSTETDPNVALTIGRWLCVMTPIVRGRVALLALSSSVFFGLNSHFAPNRHSFPDRLVPLVSVVCPMLRPSRSRAHAHPPPRSEKKKVQLLPFTVANVTRRPSWLHVSFEPSRHPPILCGDRRQSQGLLNYYPTLPLRRLAQTSR